MTDPVVDQLRPVIRRDDRDVTPDGIVYDAAAVGGTIARNMFWKSTASHDSSRPPCVERPIGHRRSRRPQVGSKPEKCGKEGDQVAGGTGNLPAVAVLRVADIRRRPSLLSV